MTDLSDISATSEAPGDRESSVARFLGQDDFLPLAVRGFGDQWNSYVQSMAWFEGRLYCGTARATSCVTNARKVGRPQLDPWPIRCPEKDYSSHIDLRAQIWRFDPAAAEWQNVYLSPLTKTKDGKDFP